MIYDKEIFIFLNHFIFKNLRVDSTELKRIAHLAGS